MNEHLHVRVVIADADPIHWHVQNGRQDSQWLTVLQRLDSEGWLLVSTVRIPNTRTADDPEMVAIFRRPVIGPLD